MCTCDDLNCSDSTGQVVNPQSWNFNWPCSVKQNIRLYFLYGDNFPCVSAITAGLPRRTGVRQIHQQAFMPVLHSADLCLWKLESLCYIYDVLSHIFMGFIKISNCCTTFPWNWKKEKCEEQWLNKHGMSANKQHALFPVFYNLSCKSQWVSRCYRKACQVYVMFRKNR